MVIRHQWGWWVNHLPSSFMKHVYLMTRSVRVCKHKSWTNNIKGRVDVHRIGVLEGQDVEVILVTEMLAHPFYAHVVGYLKNR